MWLPPTTGTELVTTVPAFQSSVTHPGQTVNQNHTRNGMLGNVTPTLEACAGGVVIVILLSSVVIGLVGVVTVVGVMDGGGDRGGCDHGDGCWY